jgi:hypothetical protein
MIAPGVDFLFNTFFSGKISQNFAGKIKAISKTFSRQNIREN